MFQLFQVLKEFGYEQLDEEYTNKPLPFKAAIPTIYHEPNEDRVLDAIFYWGDK